jgi:hypothetical protein
MPTPFDDLRCIDCDRLWSEHSRIPDDPGLHFVMDNETAEDLRRYLIAVTAERDALRAELDKMKAVLQEAADDCHNLLRRLGVDDSDDGEE